MTEKFKAVLFDLDGTLVNTIEDIRNALNYAIVQVGAREVTSDETPGYVGRGLANAIRNALRTQNIEFDDELIGRLLVELKGYYAQHCYDKSYVYPGIEELLESLVSRGIKIGVLSNKADELIQVIVGNLFRNIRFDFVQGLIEGKPRKPDRWGAGQFFLKTGMKAEDTVYVGDSEVDLETAQNAGMRLVMVCYGFRKKEDLEKLGIELFENTEQLRRKLGC